ncbi:MAG: DUF4443 domain-containing protein [Nitrososphaerota archaeon]|nr:hypothetical protein [Nitrososphaerales archaeon]MDW8045447.1 DUF4443 domain-containing protein [Nitrososphaerota archaeon]
MDSLSIKSIEELVKVRYAGPSITFSKLHIFKAIRLLGEKNILGRVNLAKELNLGLGAVRTLIQRLKDEGVIKVIRSGCILTEKGRLLYIDSLKKIPKISSIDAGKLAIDRYNVAVLVRDRAHKVKIGLEQRDAAIKEGATAATTLIFKDGKFKIPMGSENCEKDFPNDVWNRLYNTMHPQENDVIIVCSGRSQIVAEYGALSAAWTLLND